MKQINYWLVLLLLVFCSPIRAQVTIGSEYKTNKGSLLDLKENDNPQNTTKGLLLPRVKMNTTEPEIGKLAQSIGATGTWDEMKHTGLIVYNVTNTLEACTGGAEIGVYSWDGTKWLSLYEAKSNPPKTNTSTDVYPGANSYILQPGGKSVDIPVQRAFSIWNDYTGNSPNTGKVLDLADVNNLTGTMAANVVWQEADDASPYGVLDVTTPVAVTGSGATAFLNIKSGTKTGNALVNVTIGGKVLWQWHIWVVAADPTATAYRFNNSKHIYWFMGTYLGASGDKSVPSAYGLYYQWGRNTPIRKLSVDTTVANANTSERENLTTAIQSGKFISYVNKTSHDWYSPSAGRWNDRWGDSNTTATPKSPFDPCPYGWRVPSAMENLSPWNCLTLPKGGTFSNGWYFNERGRTIGFHTAAGYRSNGDGSIGDAGAVAYVWSASPQGNMAGFLHFDSSSINTWFAYNRANGMNIRCVKEIQ